MINLFLDYVGLYDCRINVGNYTYLFCLEIPNRDFYFYRAKPNPRPDFTKAVLYFESLNSLNQVE